MDNGSFCTCQREPKPPLRDQAFLPLLMSYPLQVSSSLLPTRCYWYFRYAFAILQWFISSWSCHHCIARLNDAVFSCTTTCNLVSSCLMFYSPWHTSFNVLLMMNRILLACDYSNAPLLSNPMRVLFNHRFSPFEFSERSESQLLFPTQS